MILSFAQQNKKSHTDGPDVRVSNPHLSFAAGFGTTQSLQVAGFHRAVPSTTLDKACMQFVIILSIFPQKSSSFFDYFQYFLFTIL